MAFTLRFLATVISLSVSAILSYILRKHIQYHCHSVFTRHFSFGITYITPSLCSVLAVIAHDLY